MLVNEPRFIALALTEDWDAAGNVTKRHRRTLTDLTDDQATEVVAACAKGWHEAGYEVRIGATPSPDDAPGVLPLPWATATPVHPTQPAGRSWVWVIPAAADPTGTEPPIVAAE